MTVYQNERTFDCSAIAEVLAGGDPDYPFSWVIFIQDEGEDYEVKAYTYYQSKYPPYFDANGNMALFYEGVSGIKVRVIWDSYNHDSEGHENPVHAYFDISLKYISDDWTTVNNAIFRQVSSSPNGTNYPPYEGQLESTVNRMYALALLQMGVATLTKRTSSSAVMNNITYRMTTKVWVIDPEATRFWYATKSDMKCDYRIFQGMTFATAAEWLAWCKAH